MLVISHDRDLLDDAVDHILHLDRGKLTLYRGGYDASSASAREKQALARASCEKKQEAERKHLQAFVDRFRAKASKARQAQSRMKMLAKMEPIAALVDDERAPFRFRRPEQAAGPPIIAMEGVSGRLRASGPVLQRLDLRIDDRRPHRAARRQRQRQVDLRQAARRPARADGRRA